MFLQVIIRKKRDGLELSPHDFETLIAGATDGSLSEVFTASVREVGGVIIEPRWTLLRLTASRRGP